MSVQGQLKETQGFNWILDDQDVIQNRLLTQGIHEWAETTLLPNFISEGDIVFDIGANIGYYSLLFSKWVGDKGRVYSFEPLPITYERLDWHIRINNLQNVVPHKRAVGDKASVSHYRPGGGSNLGGYSIVGIECEQNDDSVEIETIRLDDFVGQHRLPSVDFLKIDVEGYEPLVLKGAMGTIQAFKPKIMIEVLGKSCERFGITPQELLKPIQDAGYDIMIIQKRPELKLLPLHPKDLEPPVHLNAICIPKKRPLNLRGKIRKILSN